MKTLLSALLLVALIGAGYRAVEAQAYGPYYYGPYGDLQYQYDLQRQQYLEHLRQADPYYELHVMHYQLYRQPFPPYPFYAPCCYAWSIVPQYRGFHAPRPLVDRFPRSSRRR